ncbi:MAG: hypothetical protein KAS46_06715 [Candidatus Aureabacteria bacterium]|nr:hypothetical protein [Candidatus Auribacterota bacterium]
MADFSEKEHVVSIKDYLQIIFRRKSSFLVPFLVVFLTALIGSFFLPRYYKSSVLMLVEEEAEVVNPLARETRLPQTAQKVSLAEQMQTLTFKILNYPNLIRLVRDLGLASGINDPLAFEKLISGIQKRTETKMRAPEVFEISYEDKNPQLSQSLINTLIRIFIEESSARKKRRALVGVAFAESEADLYKKKLEESEKTLYEYKKKYPLQLPGTGEDFNIKMLINYQTQLTSINMALNESEKEVEILKRQISGQEPVIITEELITLNPIVNRLNNKLQDLQLKLDMLMTETPESPEVLNVQLEIEDVSEKLNLETKKVVDGETAVTAPLFYQRLEQKLKDAHELVDKLNVRKEKLINLVKEYEDKIKSLDEQQMEYVRLFRDSQVNKKIYDMLLIKAEENRLTADEVKEKGTVYEILEDARLPLQPSKPKKLLIAIVAFVIGTLSGFGCVFLTEFADHSLHGVEDVRKYMKLPILGSISKIELDKEMQNGRVRHKKIVAVIAILFLVFIIMVSINSCIQDRKITQEIIRTSVSNNVETE